MICKAGDQPDRKLKIVFFPAVPPVGYFRQALPGAALAEQRGHDVVLLQRNMPRDDSPGAIADAMAANDKQTAEAGEDADIVITGAMRSAFNRDYFEHFFPKAKLVVDMDDAQWEWLAYKNEFLRVTGQTIHRDYEDVLPTLDSWMQGADAITVTTELLAEVVRRHTKAPVYVCPNALPSFEGLKPEPNLAGMTAKAKRQLGWTGSAAHILDVIQCQAIPAISQLMRKEILRVDTSWAPRTMGWLGPADLRPMLPEKCKCIFNAAVPFPLYYPVLKALNAYAAVIPMQPTAFNRGKSAITLWSWAAMGTIPIVRCWGPYAVEHYAGFPAVWVHEDTIEAWSEAIESLDNPITRMRYKRDCATFVAEKRSAARPEYALAYERAFMEIAT